MPTEMRQIFQPFIDVNPSQLDGLASGAGVLLATTFRNDVGFPFDANDDLGGWPWLRVALGLVAPASARATGANVQIWFRRMTPWFGQEPAPSRPADVTFWLPNDNTQISQIVDYVPAPTGVFNVFVRNNTGVAFGTGNKVHISPHTLEGFDPNAGNEQNPF